LVISDPTGVGESWLIHALGNEACREGVSVVYRRAPRLFANPAIAPHVHRRTISGGLQIFCYPG
jgi:hypothetical protein